MNSETEHADKVLRTIFAIVTSIAAVLFFFMFVAVCVFAVCENKIDDDGLGLAAGLGSIGLLTFLSAYVSWRLWRGALSSNGVTYMPTWFIQMFGVLFLVGIACSAFQQPNYLFLAESVSIAFSMILFGRHLAKTKEGIEHEA